MRFFVTTGLLGALLSANALAAALRVDVDADCPCGVDYSFGVDTLGSWSAADIDCIFEPDEYWRNQMWGHTEAVADFEYLSVTTFLDADYPGEASMAGYASSTDKFWVDLPGTGSLILDLQLDMQFDWLGRSTFYFGVNGDEWEYSQASLGPGSLRYHTAPFVLRDGQTISLYLSGSVYSRAYYDFVSVRLGRITVLDESGTPFTHLRYRSDSGTRYKVEGGDLGPNFSTPELPTEVLTSLGLGLIALRKGYGRTNS